jgi:hypothetical protein
MSPRSTPPRECTPPRSLWPAHPPLSTSFEPSPSLCGPNTNTHRLVQLDPIDPSNGGIDFGVSRREGGFEEEFEVFEVFEEEEFEVFEAEEGGGIRVIEDTSELLVGRMNN